MASKHISSLSNVAVIFLYFSFFTFSTTAVTLDDEEFGLYCVYTIYIRTSKTISGGTDSNISVALYDETGNGVYIKDLVAWGGLMGQGHDYFERGNLDIFSGLGPCLYRPVCYMELISDGSGQYHSWYCNYVEVTTTGSRYVGCSQQLFTVEEWLAFDNNTSSNELIVRRDACNNNYGLKRRRPGSTLLPVEILLAAPS